MNLFLIISMEIIEVDDCIGKIYLEDNTILYERNYPFCDGPQIEYPNPIVDKIPYDIGQKIFIDLVDLGTLCRLKIKVYVNNIAINNDDSIFWNCINCYGDNGGYLYDSQNFVLSCYDNAKDYHAVNGTKYNFIFYFKINFLSQLGFDISEYTYYLTKDNYFYISSLDLNEDIELIDFYLINNLYAKNGNNELITPYYEYIKYKLFFDKYLIYSGKFIGVDKSNNDIELDENKYSRISINKPLRYRLSQLEKNNNGVHLKVKIGIFNNLDKRVSELEDFNFYICLNGYQFCDIETSLKCLKEGYYNLNDKYYSCYKTCKTCDTYKKPNSADYFKHYCDTCKSEYPYYINMTEKDENGNNISYLSCYEACPLHAPNLKEEDNKECISFCPKYKTDEGKCLEFCDSELNKYLYENEKICYNYIPKNYYIYIDNYNNIYQDIDKPIIKLSNKCPNESYDSSFNNYCIKLEEDIFHFVQNPNNLITYNNPIIKFLETKNMVIRAYSFDKKMEDINDNKNKFIRIDISRCVDKLKQNNTINNEESIIVQDIFNLDSEKYLFKIFNNEGQELNINICEKEDIIIKYTNYLIEKDLNSTKCPKEYPYLDIVKNSCLKSCDIISFLNKSCITDYINEDNKKNNINNIKNAIESNDIDHLLDNIIKGGGDITIEEQNITYQLSSTNNQNNINYENISNIQLGKCENILKEKYNISLNDSLLILKVDIRIEGYSAPMVEYEVYHPYTKEKLNLKYCENDQINIGIPVSINEDELNKYNPKSEFYNDICSTYTSEFGTDITLKDRQNEFLEKNMSLCENNCDYLSYNYTLKKVECKCNVKLGIKDLSELKIDKESLKSKFNIKDMINIYVIKCYKKLFTKNGLIHNIGSYILLSIIFLYIINLIYLIHKDFKSLKNEIIKYFFPSIFNKRIHENNIIMKSNNNKIQIHDSAKRFRLNPGLSKNASSNSKMLHNRNSNGFNIFSGALNKKNPNIIQIKKIAKKQDKKPNTNKKIDNNKNSLNNKKIYPKIPRVELKHKLPHLNDCELNDYSYEKALLYDKRTFCQYFCSLIKLEHLLFFAIIPSKDYNSKAIKICIFLFSFALNLTDNALFIDEENMHNIYELKGVYDIINQIPQILYSYIITSIINFIIIYFSLTQKDIIEKKNNLNKSIDIPDIPKYKKLIQIIFIKFVIFFIISFIFLLFFWLYISCFCFIYKNTQIYLIIDSLFSFGLSMLSPFIFYFISSIFRINSLKNKGKKYCFIFSKLIY